MSSTDAGINQLVDIFLTNYPTSADREGFAGDIVTLHTGSKATVTFTIQDGWDIFVKHIYADARNGSAYQIVAGQLTINDLNEAIFTRPVQAAGQAVTILISNASGADLTYGYYIEGWLRKSVSGTVG